MGINYYFGMLYVCVCVCVCVYNNWNVSKPTLAFLTFFGGIINWGNKLQYFQ
jgi:hypothetical protein